MRMAALSSIRTQARSGTGEPMATSGQPEPVDELDLVRGHRDVQRDDAVDPLPQHVLRQGEALVVAVVLEVEEDDVVAAGPQALLDRADQGREEPPGQERRDDRDDAGAPGGERRRRGGGHVVQVLRHPQHALPGLGRDPVKPPKGAGDRGDRDPGHPRHIGDGADLSFLSPGPGRQPFSPPASRPRTKYRCRARNTTSGTIIEMNAPADSRYQALPRVPGQLGEAHGDRRDVRACRPGRPARRAGRSRPRGTGRCRTPRGPG